MNTKDEYIDEENEKKVKAQLDFIEAIIEEEDFLTKEQLEAELKAEKKEKERILNVNEELKGYYKRKIKELEKEIETEKLRSIKNKLKALKKQYETGLKTLSKKEIKE